MYLKFNQVCNLGIGNILNLFKFNSNEMSLLFAKYKVLNYFKT
jgi:hypothetical protein